MLPAAATASYKDFVGIGTYEREFEINTTGYALDRIGCMADAAPSWRRHIPNALTGARVLLAAAVIWLLSARVHIAHFDEVTPRPPHWTLLAAAGLFILAALTDALDGALARRWNVISRFGRIMDPFADKLLVTGSFVALAGPAFWVSAGAVGGTSGYQISGVAPWMAVLILARELLVTSLRGVLEAEGIDFSASLTGKLKMIAQSVCVPLILLVVAEMPANPGSLGRYIVVSAAWATVTLTTLSILPYIRRAARVSFRAAA